ncbi:hypothetical protein ABIF64_005155 [Bradyrhizobium japonicum]
MSTTTKGTITGRSRRGAPVPQFPDHDETHDAVGDHGGGDRDAVGRSQIAGGVEQQHQQHHADQQQPVHTRQIDLAGMGLGGVAHLEARQETKLHRLIDQRIGAGDHSLARDHGRRGRKSNQRQHQTLGHHAIERMLDRAGIGQHQRALPEIVDQERGQHEEHPGRLDRLAAEMAEIGVERLAARHCKEHGAERHQADRAVRQQELQCVIGIDCRQHRRIVGDVHGADQRKNGEPDHHHRPEGRGHQRRPLALDCEQQHQDDDGERYDIVLEGGGHELQTLDRRQHRDGRRDHGIADEHGGADHAEREQEPASPPERALAERHQRERATLPVIVGAQQQQDVFGGDDDKERPKNQRKHAEHHDPRDRLAMGRGLDRLVERVQRRGADIAEDNTDASERQAPETRGDRPVLSVGRCDARRHVR